MCDKCEQVESAITRYRQFIAGGVLDPLTTERINALIQELQQRKCAFQGIVSTDFRRS
jgi:ABC-type transporter Mla maintaining outer membrane lipid asymmetry ATPase subunit MlaF